MKKKITATFSQIHIGDLTMNPAYNCRVRMVAVGYNECKSKIFYLVFTRQNIDNLHTFLGDTVLFCGYTVGNRVVHRPWFCVKKTIQLILLISFGVILGYFQNCSLQRKSLSRDYDFYLLEVSKNSCF